MAESIMLDKAKDFAIAKISSNRRLHIEKEKTMEQNKKQNE